MSSGARSLYVTFAVLSALTLFLAALLVRQGAELKPVRGAPPFDLDEPPANTVVMPGR